MQSHDWCYYKNCVLSFFVGGMSEKNSFTTLAEQGIYWCYQSKDRLKRIRYTKHSVNFKHNPKSFYCWGRKIIFILNSIIFDCLTAH